MSQFNVLLLAEQHDAAALKLSIRSFSDMYHSETPKHQRNMKLTVVVPPKSTSSKRTVEQLISDNEIASVTSLHFVTIDEAIDSVYADTSILLQSAEPKDCTPYRSALSYSIPIVWRDSKRLQECIDYTCGIRVHYDTKEQYISDCSRFLLALYHDEGAYRMLRNGAKKQYEATIAQPSLRRA